MAAISTSPPNVCLYFPNIIITDISGEVSACCMVHNDFWGQHFWWIQPLLKNFIQLVCCYTFLIKAPTPKIVNNLPPMLEGASIKETLLVLFLNRA
ncbi:uncharacterized protein ARMOST_10091 [Armillaria ostoyae]|uniref:Uncharacterized protein n=1 Tax=Armillaria ostoyae TaxID=47428 RepID=A0A284RDC2_ARMOS|nr:uncharacterized protein ARMOST_10091 [Armillaria ostoyae]